TGDHIPLGDVVEELVPTFRVLVLARVGRTTDEDHHVVVLVGGEAQTVDARMATLVLDLESRRAVSRRKALVDDELSAIGVGDLDHPGLGEVVDVLDAVVTGGAIVVGNRLAHVGPVGPRAVGGDRPAIHLHRRRLRPRVVGRPVGPGSPVGVAGAGGHLVGDVAHRRARAAIGAQADVVAGAPDGVVLLVGRRRVVGIDCRVQVLARHTTGSPHGVDHRVRDLVPVVVPVRDPVSADDL